MSAGVAATLAQPASAARPVSAVSMPSADMMSGAVRLTKVRDGPASRPMSAHTTASAKTSGVRSWLCCDVAVDLTPAQSVRTHTHCIEEVPDLVPFFPATRNDF
jgi:hypothetical protein